MALQWIKMHFNGGLACLLERATGHIFTVLKSAGYRGVSSTGARGMTDWTGYCLIRVADAGRWSLQVTVRWLFHDPAQPGGRTCDRAYRPVAYSPDICQLRPGSGYICGDFSGWYLKYDGLLHPSRTVALTLEQLISQSLSVHGHRPEGVVEGAPGWSIVSALTRRDRASLVAWL